ncbi:predicted protein [Sclerotinia sclerotiorum 1980 UF-70]|uniref:Uncharacterized protein n=1 Tax=Sclerotinia sclerotiorum (strain ATCC 18683 / 1980 / Ss-1) TaxID=665079 RepID=A7ESC5_SCLS1|nr:predicted protein [Sclerotinia sclerotiorum 1980 UF-70]EDN92367.1 predicted protein [Sclerotinia sclerotiorum 1980 UF-70]
MTFAGTHNLQLFQRALCLTQKHAVVRIYAEDISQGCVLNPQERLGWDRILFQY